MNDDEYYYFSASWKKFHGDMSSASITGTVGQFGSQDHVYLTSLSKMRVDLAAQVTNTEHVLTVILY